MRQRIRAREGCVDEEPDVALEEAELFRTLPPEQVERLRPLLRETHFEARQVLFFEGDPVEFLWLLRRGEVRLYKTSPNGTITTLEALGPGQIFGAVSALDQPAHPVSAEAVSGGLAWRLRKQTLLDLIRQEPGVALELLRIVSGRLREARDRLRSFAHDPAPARLARALLTATREGEAHVTRRALAEASGTSVETAIRVLRGFEREGIIRGEVGHIFVLDAGHLGRIASQRDA